MAEETESERQSEIEDQSDLGGEMEGPDNDIRVSIVGCYVETYNRRTGESTRKLRLPSWLEEEADIE